jgi:hypothetical protein
MRLTRLCVGLLAIVVIGAASGNQATQPQTQAASPLFALLFTTGPGWNAALPPAEQRFFQEHSANLRRLREAGIIVTGGRFGEYGLMLVRAPTLDSANALLRPDSSLRAGTFKVAVNRWSTVYDGAVSR